jgi:arylsulfatase A-like enzyme
MLTRDLGHVSRRTMLGAAAATLVARAASRRPNIVLLFSDDLGYECIGANGGTSYRTPNIDRMAGSGIRFTHAYAQPLCTPTRVQLMTGQYNFRNWQAFGIMHPQERTFGHMMSRAGYRTCIAGKWQLYSYDDAGTRRGIGMPPENSGFDEYSLWHAGHTEEKGSRYADPVILENSALRKDTRGKYGPDLFSEYLFRFMEKNRERPFFAYYSMPLTHGPYNPTPHSADWASGDRLGQDNRYFRDMVEYADFEIGRILRRIDELGLGRDTLVMYFSDNGTGPGLRSNMGNRVVIGGKGMTTDAGMHVPCVARWTGVIKPGTVSDELIDSTDFLPTIAEAAGTKWFAGAPLDGRSFLPQLRGSAERRRDWLFSHYDPHPGCKANFPPTRLAWDHRWKLYMDGRLFNVDRDIAEQNPIASDAGGPEADAARRKLQGALDEMARVKAPVFNRFSPG